MALHLQNICIITVYAASGAKKRREREEFFAVDVPNLIPNTSTAMILTGDFNCIMDSWDSTGQQNYSSALKNLIVNLDLQDVWSPTGLRPGYAYLGYQSASLIDRIYVTKDLYAHKNLIVNLGLQDV
jgi:endonuclease/exonuclease/phosphatase family metal-dependent hydrolase